MLTKPSIHLNGTSGESLREGYEKAIAAVDAAIEAVAQASPNARDYYPQGNTAFGAADDEHVARMRRLQEVKAELAELYEHVNGVICEREQSRSARGIRRP